PVVSPPVGPRWRNASARSAAGMATSRSSTHTSTARDLDVFITPPWESFGRTPPREYRPSHFFIPGTTPGQGKLRLCYAGAYGIVDGKAHVHFPEAVYHVILFRPNSQLLLRFSQNRQIRDLIEGDFAVDFGGFLRFIDDQPQTSLR